MLARAREKGLDGAELSALGREHDLPELRGRRAVPRPVPHRPRRPGAIDYADLIRRATLEAEVHREELRARFSHVFVDEYQDTDPGQVALLRALAGDGRNLDGRGRPAPVDLRLPRRRGPRHPRLPDRVPAPRRPPRRRGRAAHHPPLRPAPAAGLPARRPTPGTARQHRRRGPRGVPDPAQRGRGLRAPARWRCRTFDTERAEAEHLADLLRRAHLEDGIGWDEMAVLVRSGRTSIPALRRSLGAAGVPVEVASDDVPLVRDPAVRPLLDALRVVIGLGEEQPERPDSRRLERGGRARSARRAGEPAGRGARPDPADQREPVDAGRAESLLLSPLGGMDAGELRRLARQLRVREKARAAQAGESPRPSRELVRLAVVEASLPRRRRGPRGRPRPGTGRPPRRCSRRPRRRRLGRGGAVDAVVRHRLAGAAATGSRGAAAPVPGARTATSTPSARSSSWRPVRRSSATTSASATSWRRSSPSRSPPTPSPTAGLRGAAVRLLTAHRSKGLEWRLVVRRPRPGGGLARPAPPGHAAAGRPDRHRRDRASGLGARAAAEERRLFYVACTRARQRLVVTRGRLARRRRRAALPLPRRARRRPSRRSPAVPHARSRWTGLVAELRRTLADPETPEPLRAAAARRLARLARETVGRPAAWCPQADPSSWWGTRAPPAAPAPSATPSGRCRSRRSVLRVDAGLPDPVVPRARGRRHRARPPVRQPRPDRARPRRAGRRRRDPRGSRRRGPADGPRRRGVAAAGVPHPVVASPRARPGPHRAGALPALAPRQPRAACSPPSSTSRRWSSSTAASRSGSPATPTGSSSTPPGACGGRPQDRARQALQQVGPAQRPARPLPVRRGRRRRRRGARGAGRHPRAGPAGRGRRAGAARHARRGRRTPPSSRRTPSPTRAWPARSCAATSAGWRRCCARSPSRRSPASTAATARSCRCAPSRAPER